MGSGRHGGACSLDKRGKEKKSAGKTWQQHEILDNGDQFPQK